MLLQRVRPESPMALKDYSVPEGVNYRASLNWCYSAAIAYIMYRLGAPEELLQPAAIDKITGRKKFQGTKNTEKALWALLDQGAEIREVKDLPFFDTDRFDVDGMAYIEEYYKSILCKMHPFRAKLRRPWTPQQVQEVQEGITRSEQYGDQWHMEDRVATLEDFSSLLEDHVLLMTIRSSKRIIESRSNRTSWGLHSVVAVDYVRAEQPKNDRLVYFDNLCRPPFRSCKAESFYRRLFIPINGLVAVRVNDK